ncbi:hypothetical protein ACIRG5_28345 [Lentzea sp. NPDC102401]|uniref:hypothetical protein n=1 Tax=Lentzea sp. NPDC102401 TaxID=3364128 RepID=UPI0038195C41
MEKSAVTHVFETLIPEEVAHPHWDDYVTEIADPAKLELLIGSPVTDLVARVESLVGEEGKEFVSPEGTLMIAELACTVTPMPILALVVEEEQEYRETTKRGSIITSSRGEDWTISPERMYSTYLEHVRPLHELLRGWCGHRAVSLQERLGAAEAEVRRLDLLVTRLVDQLRENGHSRFADVIAEVHEEERIAPGNFRPVVDRPLKPSEIPVRYIEVPRRRRWG